MNEINALLSKRWILKREDRELYYKIKDRAKMLRELFKDKYGYTLTNHQQFVRLDKIPGKAEPWMGISEFQTPLEYEMLCYVLVFLEDKEDEEQFILSILTEFIQVQLGVNEDFWMKFVHRKMFVNVLKFCLKENLIIQDDGHSEHFVQDQCAEALFENTGLSRYFMRYFTMDIFAWQNPSDFMQNNWLDESEQDRGMIRRQRIYRRLLLSCGIYKEDDDLNDDFSYIKNYRKRIENDFNLLFPCELQVYHSSAFLIIDDDYKVGQYFPKNNALDELVVMLCSYVRELVKIGKARVDDREIYTLNRDELFKLIERCIKKFSKYLPSTYRQKNIEQLRFEIYQRLLMIGFASELESNEVQLYPVVGKLKGQFEEENI